MNRTKARLKRLKQPKYLVGAIFGFLYLYFYFFQFLFARGRPGTDAMGSASQIVESVGSIILLGLIVGAWIFPQQRAALVFTEAEIAFLFPAPINRRAGSHTAATGSALSRNLFTASLARSAELTESTTELMTSRTTTAVQGTNPGSTLQGRGRQPQ